MVWKVYIHSVRMLILALSSFVLALIGLIRVFNEKLNIIEWELIRLNSSSIVFIIVFDWISILFLSFVLLISSIVIFYSGSYIKGDENYNRFIYLVLAFVISISLIILSPNIISILLGWDGLGVVSYVLVIFYQNEKSANARILTILSNRVGDVAILLRIGLMINLGSWNFVLYTYYLIDREWMILKMLVILAAITKRAQIPFSAWLPAAIAAPTPVSALVHSSTLVTAGVYLMIRFSSGLDGSRVQRILLIISCLTIFIAGLGANFEYDLKKIIALSTLSQLGVILRILSLGYPDLSFFHLLRHALFKALLFMCAGVIIHRARGYQDIRYIGCLVKFIPLSVSFIIISNLALCGFPFIAGFYSKDIILEVAFMSWINFVALFLYIRATGLTVSYTLRLIFYRLSRNFNLCSLRNVRDEDTIICNPMIPLGLSAITIGSILSWLLFPECYIICIRSFIKNVVLLVRFVRGLVGYILNLISTRDSLKSIGLYRFTRMVGRMWFIPFLRTKVIRKINLNVGLRIEKHIDKGWYEYLGSQGLYYMFRNGFVFLYKLQINNIKVIMKMFIILLLVVVILL